MPGPDRLQLARDCYRAYEIGDWSIVEGLLTDDFTFYSPPDPGIDRETYFERVGPTPSRSRFEFVRLVELGDEVLVTYESTKSDDSRFRNTEILSFDGDKISKVEVYSAGTRGEPATTKGSLVMTTQKPRCRSRLSSLPGRGTNPGCSRAPITGAMVSVSMSICRRAADHPCTRHPYEETFIIESGRATFTVDDDQIEAGQRARS